MIKRLLLLRRSRLKWLSYTESDDMAPKSTTTVPLARPSLAICGIRGIPAQYGGFETFSERLALHLQEKGWNITVYCQENAGAEAWSDQWRGIRLLHLPTIGSTALSTAIFDWKSISHAVHQPGIILTLGYNTAAFCLRLRIKGIFNLINMDGIEWQRAKWPALIRAWLYLNERIGCQVGNHLIADHPEIKRHLETRVSADKITMIPYGADRIDAADPALLSKWSLAPKGYSLVIARPEPENSLLEIVRAFSRKRRGVRLMVLGKFQPEVNPYHLAVIQAASEEIVFAGAIYDQHHVRALRYHCLFHIHGHQVGGTNPSLVEALGAGCPVLAHDNRFNRWVAGPDSRFFASENECAEQIDQMIHNPQILQSMRKASYARHEAYFSWSSILNKYEELLLQWHNKAVR